ncbi:rod shape-determining protein RodA [Bacillaceae bacterium Marseille-Q3522]|nr:rod shape-determining protein RodA [Bacillaceae bacterium Marseille-Q3522]
MRKTNKAFDRFDWSLTLLLCLFFIVSCVAIYSGQTTAKIPDNYLLKQIIFYGAGFIIIAVVMFFDHEQIKKLSWFLYGFGMLLLLILFFAPVTDITPIINGAQSWFVIPGFGTLQPSEFMKVFLILALSKVLSDHNEKTEIKTIKTDLFLLVKIGGITALPLGFVLKQNDLGTSLVYIAITAGIILVSGITWKIIIPLFTGGISLAGTVLYFVVWAPDLLEKYLKVQGYQFNRIYTWLDPENSNSDAAYQLLNSLKGIGSGILTGKGIGERQVHVPEAHTDFIFSVIGEEYGFFGGSIVISLFFLLIYHITKTALDTNNPFNSYICVGIISMITFHVFQNIGMTIQLLPITGIPLPFISSGGSSLLGNMFAMGLIYSIRFHHKTYMFASKSE